MNLKKWMYKHKPGKIYELAKVLVDTMKRNDSFSDEILVVTWDKNYYHQITISYNSPQHRGLIPVFSAHVYGFSLELQRFNYGEAWVSHLEETADRVQFQIEAVQKQRFVDLQEVD